MPTPSSYSSGLNREQIIEKINWYRDKWDDWEYRDGNKLPPHSEDLDNAIDFINNLPDEVIPHFYALSNYYDHELDVIIHCPNVSTLYHNYFWGGWIVLCDQGWACTEEQNNMEKYRKGHDYYSENFKFGFTYEEEK